MNTLKVRKNFLLDKEIIEKAQTILLGQQKNLTEALNLFFRAIVKEPSILETIEKSANKRTGSFIGMLDGEIGDVSFKEMRQEYSKKREL
ncbi:MAG: hypothetical protein GXO60_09700 [Epsilonproteobacteria bacterium]|nr:hypothetical protein [Campylobacterota bacterium]